jgi:hypothetical protein
MRQKDFFPAVAAIIHSKKAFSQVVQRVIGQSQRL